MCVLIDYSATSEWVELVYDNGVRLIIAPLFNDGHEIVGIDKITIDYTNKTFVFETRKFLVSKDQFYAEHSDGPIWLDELPWGTAQMLHDTWDDFFNWPQYDHNPDFRQANNILADILEVPNSLRRPLALQSRQTYSPSVL